MAVLAGIFSNGQEQAQDSDKLMHLFWKRTELKKEFARLRNEKYRLSDQVKQQEGKTAKANQNFEHLEQLLAEPGSALSVLVHYQLRGLGLRCESKLARFAEELKQQCERKQRNMVLMAWNDERNRQRRLLDRKLTNLRESLEQVEGRLRLEEKQVHAMGFFKKMLRRRTLNAKLEFLRRKVARLRGDEAELESKLEIVKNQRPPENSGLDLTSKRLINFKIIAFAQHLFLQLGGSQFAGMVKQTMDRSAGGTDYGDKAKCDQFLERVHQLARALDQHADLSDVLDQRAELIGQTAKFGSDNDVVPIPNSVASLYAVNEQGAMQKAPGSLNILGENYWGIAKILAR